MTLDRATREREYSPSSCLGGDYAPFLERYRLASEAAHRALRVDRDLPYGPAPRQRIDYFPGPGSRSPRASGLLVYLHGGYWQELDKAWSAFLAPAWHAAGIAHAVVGYSLAPTASLPRIVDECRAALAWLRAHASALGFDPEAIVVAGSSAGAYLAAACATGGDAVPRGIVPVSGIFDVAPLVGTSINDALGLDVDAAASLNLLSPAARPRCRAVVAWGEIETAAFKRQSRAYAAHVAAAGLPCTTVEIADRNHFDVILELGDPASALFAAARALFAPEPT